MSAAEGRLNRFRERADQLAAVPKAPKIEVGALEEVCSVTKTPKPSVRGSVDQLALNTMAVNMGSAPDEVCSMCPNPSLAL